MSAGFEQSAVFFARLRGLNALELLAVEVGGGAEGRAQEAARLLQALRLRQRVPGAVVQAAVRVLAPAPHIH